jgi:short-subunit dehydrogenase
MVSVILIINYGMRVMKINTLAPLKVSEAFLPQISRSSRKLIVVLTSLMGSIADNRGGGSLMYRSSKRLLMLP